MQITLEQFSELLGLIYQGPMEAIPWGSALTRLRTHLKSNWITMILRPAAANLAALVIRDGGNGAELYDSSYKQFSVFSLDPFVGLPRDKPVTIDEMIEAKRWLSGEFFKQYLEPNQIRYILGADITAEGGTEFRLRATRAPAAADFSAADKAFCQVLIAHFKRAVNLHSRMGLMEVEMKLYATAMDSMLVGAVVLDEKGVVMRVNSIAEKILDDKDGININRGQLTAEYRGEDRELQRLIRLVLEMPAGKPAIAEATSLTRPSGRTKLGLLIRPIPVGEWSEGPHRPAVVVFIRDPERKSQPSFELVRQLFDLTPAEARLALLLADGMTLDEAAEALEIRKNTIRAHLRSIFSKTGVKRQTTLVSLMLSSVAAIR
ncbi:MAG: LuxR C-terminal-related transcriptional regulator [Betaproteobacteria bacterium]